MRKRVIAVAVSVCLLAGCHFARRHPIMTAVAVEVPALVAGGALGDKYLEMDNQFDRVGAGASLGLLSVGLVMIVAILVTSPPRRGGGDDWESGGGYSDPAAEAAANRRSEEMLRRTGGPIGANIPGYDPSRNNDSNATYDPDPDNASTGANQPGARPDANQPGARPNPSNPARPDPCPPLQAALNQCTARRVPCNQACNQRLNACRDNCMAQQTACKEPGAFTTKCVGVYGRCSNVCDANYAGCDRSCGNCSSQHSAWLNTCGRVRPAM